MTRLISKLMEASESERENILRQRLYLNCNDHEVWDLFSFFKTSNLKIVAKMISSYKIPTLRR